MNSKSIRENVFVFSRTVLKQPNGEDKFILPGKPWKNQTFNVLLVLPLGVTCSQCILQVSGKYNKAFNVICIY